jgi:hypothetical protein
MFARSLRLAQTTQTRFANPAAVVPMLPWRSQMNLRKAAQITAMQAKPFPCRRYYSRGSGLIDTAE